MGITKTAAIMGVVNAALALLLAFGIDVSQDQQAAITGIVNALLLCGAAFLDPEVPFGNQKPAAELPPAAPPGP